MPLSVTLILMLSTAIDAFITIYFFNQSLHPRTSKIVIYLTIIPLFIGAKYLLTFSIPAQIVVSWILVFALAVFFYQNKFWYKTCIWLIAMALATLSEVIVNLVIQLLGWRMDQILQQHWLMFYSVLISIFSYTLLYVVTAKLLKKLMLSTSTNLYFLMPFLGSQAAIGFIASVTISFTTSITNAIFFLSLIAMFVVSDFFIYRILKKISEQAQEAELLKSLEQQIKNQYDYYRAQLHSLEDIRAIRHDVKNQIQTAYALLAQQHTEDAQSLLDRLTQHVQSAEIPFFCENEIVNALLFNKYNQMKDLGISFSHNIALDNRFFLDDAILCSLFANTLDNAINACSAINDPQTDKRINIKAGMRNEHFVLRVENSFTGEIQIEDGVPVSAKKDGHSGYGSQILAMIAKRCNGSVEYKIEDKSFVVAVLLPLRD